MAKNKAPVSAYSSASSSSSSSKSNPAGAETDDNISVETEDILELSEMFKCLNQFLISKNNDNKNITDVLCDIQKELKEIRLQMKKK